jgi:hypothetical protein
MARDESLNARPDVNWVRVVLRDRMTTELMWRALAEVWAEKPDLVADQLDRLAEALGGGGWDTALDDVESDLRMPESEVELREDEARRLACELTTAADLTSTARRRAEPIQLPTQRDCGEAAA